MSYCKSSIFSVRLILANFLASLIKASAKICSVNWSIFLEPQGVQISLTYQTTSTENRDSKSATNMALNQIAKDPYGT